MSTSPAIPVYSDMHVQAGTYGGGVAGAKVSVNDSETVRPVIEHFLWFHSGGAIGRVTGKPKVITINFNMPDLSANRTSSYQYLTCPVLSLTGT